MHNARTVLVVEAEFLIALDLQRLLESHAFTQTVLARTPAEALAQRVSWGDLGLAVVEMRRDSREAVELCHLLRAQGVPLVVTTGDARMRQGVPKLTGTPVLVKPWSDEDFAFAYGQALALQKE